MKNQSFIIFFSLIITFSLKAQTNTLPISGDVGIGTTNPAAKFHVYESTTLGGNQNNFQLLSRISGKTGSVMMENKWLLRGAAGASWITARIHNGLSVDSSFLTPGVDTRTWWERDPFSGNQFWGNSSDTQMALVGGNVGIGSSMPTSKLEVKDYSANSNKWVAAFKGGGQDVGKYSGIQIFNGYSSEYNKWVGLTAASESGASNITGLGIYTSESTSAHTEKVRVTGSGNVGIGTSSPTSKLEVKGSVLLKSDSYVNYAIERGNGAKSAFGISSSSHDGFLSSSGNLKFLTNNNGTTYITSMFLNSTGNVGIGTTNPDAKLAVNGNIHTKEVKVDLVGWSDFVFENNYNLPTLKEVEQHIKEKGHLKDIPSAEEVGKNGFFLGEMDSKLLQKIEELTLYTINQEKRIKTLESKNEELIVLVKKLIDIEIEK